ncbi:Response regulator receiver domain-containing protein [Halopelagius inordinatus]|uniref:Response regulator receiver domain-containing protein n=1 Tax=Halopelagius inordinatus TaxID=553467 RepID=A0A1I2MFC7_9EURY|nr:response regulator [Halopelagius inordinatus]SFF90184.1 Response regulator receiver domain-containing protein [Halopelagius inordinatus]
MAEDPPTVLVVEDEEAVVEAYAMWLSDVADVRTATGGREALQLVDGDVDAVLLDRRMPDLSGDETLAEIRERGFDCRVAMVTAVDPAVDVDGVNASFDTYLTKPVTKEEIVDAVGELLERPIRDGADGG